MKTIRDVLAHMQQDRQATVSLMITEFCNFECDHCFYGCSNRNPRKYISNDTLGIVYQRIRELNDYLINVTVNIIGGEPTANLKEFERVWNTVDGWRDYPDIGMEMTTNGWWLKSAKTAREFFRAIEYSTRGGVGIEDGLSIRISGDQFHDTFRDFDAKRVLESVFDYGAINDEYVLYEEIGICTECGHQPRDKYRSDCPKCKAKDSVVLEEGNDYIQLPENDPNMPWIYVEEDHLGYDGVIPSGVRGQFGRNVSEYHCTEGCDVRSMKGCYFDEKLTFLPNGKHTDGCCRGSLMPFGDVSDHFLVLMALNWNFLEDCEPNCWSCRSDAEEWAERPNTQDLRIALYDELQLLEENHDLVVELIEVESVETLPVYFNEQAFATEE